MKKIINLLTMIIPAVVLISLITGCTDIKDSNSVKPESATTAYFHKGVYKSYSPASKNTSQYYFYIFYDENSGYTEDSELGIGLPFSCIQTVDSIKFKFGGAEEPEEVFKIKSIKKNVVTGSFKNDELLIFVPVPKANPDKFDALEYIKNEKNGRIETD